MDLNNTTQILEAIQTSTNTGIEGQIILVILIWVTWITRR